MIYHATRDWVSDCGLLATFVEAYRACGGRHKGVSKILGMPDWQPREVLRKLGSRRAELCPQRKSPPPPEGVWVAFEGLNPRVAQALLRDLGYPMTLQSVRNAQRLRRKRHDNTD